MARNLIILFALSICACGADRAEHAFVKRSAPKRYRSIQVAPNATQVVRVKAYVDDAYVQATMLWEQGISEQLELATTLAEPIQVRFELVGTERWSPSAGSPNALLAEISAIDPDEADIIVAFTGPLEEVSRNHHQLGTADILGRYMAVRAINSAAEWDALKAEMGQDDDALRRSFRDRVRQKQAAIFLHEFGHLNGAIHTQSDGWLMSTVYDRHNEQFCPTNADIIRAVTKLRRELRDRGDLVRAAARRVRLLTEGDGNHGLEPQELASLIALESQGELMGNATYASVRRAQKLTNESQYEEALVALAPALEAAPENPTVVQIHCFLKSRGQDNLAEALNICVHAAKRNTDDFLTAISAGQVLQKMGRWEESMHWIQVAERRLRATAHPRTSQWISLSNAYVNAFAFELAERALAAVGVPVRQNEVQQRLTRMRQLACMPAGRMSGLEERTAVAEGQDLMARTYSKRATRAEIEAFRAKFPRAPMGRAAQCVRDLGRRGPRANLSVCDAVLESYSDCWPVRISLGRYHLKRREWNLALPHLERAYAIQPDEDIHRDLEEARRNVRQ